MVILSPTPALVLVLCTSLSACGGIIDAIEFGDDRDAFRDRRDMLNSKSNTAYRAIPEDGSQTYRGQASLGVGDTARGVVLLGDASVTVDFKNRTVSGEAGNFGGFDNTEDYADYIGTLVLQDGVLGSVDPNDIDTRMAGTLRGGGNTIEVDALLEGHLKGTPIAGVLVDTTQAESTFTLNGDTVTGGIVVAVDN